MNPSTCYMCERPSTSKEHVPPKCLFPEFKDVERQYRQNLITVPSCDEHNSQKSADDEFLMASLAGIIGNNAAGYLHKFTKVNRAIHRSSFGLLEQALSNQRWELLEIAPGMLVDVVWGKPDSDRLDRCFDRISRGLYFYHFSRRFRGQIKCIFANVNTKEHNPAEFQRFIRDKFAFELKDKKRIGDNPEVFSYQFTDTDQFGLLGLHLQFYGGLDVYIAVMPEESKLPTNMAMELIDIGIPTIIKLGDKEYKFNVDKE